MPVTLSPNGPFQYPGTNTPVAGGSVQFVLSAALATVIQTGATLANYAPFFNFDSSGNMNPASQMYGNVELNPAGTYYNMTVYASPGGTGSVVYSTSDVVVGGWPTRGSSTRTSTSCPRSPCRRTKSTA